MSPVHVEGFEYLKALSIITSPKDDHVPKMGTVPGIYSICLDTVYKRNSTPELLLNVEHFPVNT